MHEPSSPPTEAPTRSSGLVPLVLAAIGLSLLAAGLGWWLGGRTTQASADGSAYPELLRVFEMPSVDGRNLGPRSFPGQVVLVDFWATWCTPCHLQARILAELHKEYRDRGVQFLAVSVGEERETVIRFVGDRPFPYPVLYDEPGRLGFEAGVVALPTLMVMSQNGEITFLREGITSGRELREVLDGLLADSVSG